jgi:hypothetical protein
MQAGQEAAATVRNAQPSTHPGSGVLTNLCTTVQDALEVAGLATEETNTHNVCFMLRLFLLRE